MLPHPSVPFLWVLLSFNTRLSIFGNCHAKNRIFDPCCGTSSAQTMDMEAVCVSFIVLVTTERGAVGWQSTVLCVVGSLAASSGIRGPKRNYTQQHVAPRFRLARFAMRRMKLKSSGNIWYLEHQSYVPTPVEKSCRQITKYAFVLVSFLQQSWRGSRMNGIKPSQNFSEGTTLLVKLIRKGCMVIKEDTFQKRSDIIQLPPPTKAHCHRLPLASPSDSG